MTAVMGLAVIGAGLVSGMAGAATAVASTAAPSPTVSAGATPTPLTPRPVATATPTLAASPSAAAVVGSPSPSPSNAGTQNGSNFRPTATGHVAALSTNGVLTDMVSATAGDSAWPTDPRTGAFLEVPFDATVYRVTRDVTTPSAGIPADASPARTKKFTVTKSAVTDPIAVTIPGNGTPGTEYVFVTHFDSAGRSHALDSVLPLDYTWTSSFGVASQKTIVPMRLRLSTHLLSSTADGRGTAEVTIRHEGGWLTDATGSPIPVVLKGQYLAYPPGATMASTDVAPTDATVLGETVLTVTSDGTYAVSTSATGASAATYDMRTTWRWSLVAADQPAETQGWANLVAQEVPQSGKLNPSPEQASPGLPATTAATGLPATAAALPPVVLTPDALHAAAPTRTDRPAGHVHGLPRGTDLRQASSTSQATADGARINTTSPSGTMQVTKSSAGTALPPSSSAMRTLTMWTLGLLVTGTVVTTGATVAMAVARLLPRK